MENGEKIIIKTMGLTKCYESLVAVDGLNINIEEGTFYGLLGPNGAGKTTTLKMLSMLLAPTKGKIEIDGYCIDRKVSHIKSIMGVVSQHYSLQRDMTVEETLYLHGMLHKMRRKDIRLRVHELLGFANMMPYKKQLLTTLSGGNKRKLMIIRALMHEPKILFLDEPTVGLDPSIRRIIWDFLKTLKGKGLTIVLTTHYIEEANVLCDRIGMMRQGIIQMENTPQGFLASMPQYTAEVFDGDKTRYIHCNSREEALKTTATVNGDISIRKTNLEDVYVELTKERGALK